jgi:hypothetical protein
MMDAQLPARRRPSPSADMPGPEPAPAGPGADHPGALPRPRPPEAPGRASHDRARHGLSLPVRPVLPARIQVAPSMQLDFKFLSSAQHAYRNHSDEVAVITVRLFDHTLLADMEMLYINEIVFGVRDAGSAAYGLHAPLSRRTGRRIALAAAYALTVAYRMRQHLFAVQPVICCSLKHKPLCCGVYGNRMQ